MDGGIIFFLMKKSQKVKRILREVEQTGKTEDLQQGINH